MKFGHAHWGVGLVCATSPHVCVCGGGGCFRVTDFAVTKNKSLNFFSIPPNNKREKDRSKNSEIQSEVDEEKVSDALRCVKRRLITMLGLTACWIYVLRHLCSPKSAFGDVRYVYSSNSHRLL